MREIPTPDSLTPYSEQRTQFTDRNYKLRFAFNFLRNLWTFDLIADDGTALLEGVTLFSGANLFRRNPDSRMPQGQLWVVGRASQLITPTLVDWEAGASVLLYFEPGEDIAA